MNAPFGAPYRGGGEDSEARFAAGEPWPLLHFLIVTEAKVPEFISVTLREALDFTDDIEAEFGDFYVVATESTWTDGTPR